MVAWDAVVFAGLWNWIYVRAIPYFGVFSFVQALVKDTRYLLNRFRAQNFEKSVVDPIRTHRFVVFELGDGVAHFFGGYCFVQQVERELWNVLTVNAIKFGHALRCLDHSLCLLLNLMEVFNLFFGFCWGLRWLDERARQQIKLLLDVIYLLSILIDECF